MFKGAMNNNPMPTFFLKMLLAVFVLRLGIAAWLPMSGDEAYFIVWGKNLDYGYYDHTPVVGWILAALLSVSDATLWLRMPSVLLPVFIAYGMYRILQPRLPDAAMWIALAYLVAPVNLINILITTDTPLIFFSFISGWYFYLALYESRSNKDFLLSGLFLGLAFFSKYFAVLLGFSYGFYILFFHRDKKNLAGLGLVVLMVLPFVGLNILWNYNHCWNNILFNLFNRTAGADDIFSSLVKYLVMLAYLFSPVVIYYLVKNRSLLKANFSENFYRVFLWLAFFPLVLFLFLLLRKEVGLHWVLSFYSFAFMGLASVLTIKQWRWTFHFMWLFSLVHIIAVSAIMLMPVETFAGKKEAVENLTFGKYPEEVLAHLKPYEKEYTLATISYGMSSVLSYYTRKHVIVFDKASYHAREDERLTDYRKLDGKNILIFKRTASNLEQLRRFFAHSERKSFKVREATYELLIGNGFNYALYYEEVIKPINQDFYSIPDWLPIGQCEFKEKYGFADK